MSTERPRERFDGQARRRVRPVEGRVRPVEGEESIRDRFRHLATDSAELVRREIDLAKLEMKELARQFMQDGAKLAVAAGLAALGALALTACVILLIGLALDGAYWAGALIVGALFLLVGAVLVRNAVNDLRKREWKPDETIETLEEDQRFARQEAKEFRHRIQS